MTSEKVVSPTFIFWDYLKHYWIFVLLHTFLFVVWLLWVFAAVHRLSLVVTSRDYSLAEVCGLIVMASLVAEEEH